MLKTSTHTYAMPAVQIHFATLNHATNLLVRIWNKYYFFSIRVQETLFVRNSNALLLYILLYFTIICHRDVNSELVIIHFSNVLLVMI